MGLLSRLINPTQDEDSLPVHQFMAALAEYKRGAVTGAQVVAAFNLNANEAISLQEFLDGLTLNQLDRAIIHDVLLLGESGHYTINFVKTRLGLS